MRRVLCCAWAVPVPQCSARDTLPLALSGRQSALTAGFSCAHLSATASAGRAMGRRARRRTFRSLRRWTLGSGRRCRAARAGTWRCARRARPPWLCSSGAFKRNPPWPAQVQASARAAHAGSADLLGRPLGPCGHALRALAWLGRPPRHATPSPPEQKRPLHGKTCRVSGHGFMSQQEGRAGRSVDLRALRAATSASRPAASWPSMRPRRRPTARAARRAACCSARWACRPRTA